MIDFSSVHDVGYVIPPNVPDISEFAPRLRDLLPRNEYRARGSVKALPIYQQRHASRRTVPYLGAFKPLCCSHPSAAN